MRKSFSRLIAVLLAVVMMSSMILMACGEKYTVTFNSNGGSEVASAQVKKDTLVKKPDDPTKEGFTFAGWFKDEALTEDWKFDTDKVTADITLYAKWDAVVQPVERFTVTFNSNGGSNVSSVTVDKDSLLTKPQDPTRAGFVFAGWFKDSNLSQEWNFNTDKVTQNITLYAKWAEETVTVSFDTDGGSSVAPVTVAKGGKVTAPANPTKDGYLFDGWYKDSAKTQAWNFATDTVSANTTIYAKWLEAVTAAFNSNGGSPVDSVIVAKGSTITKPADPTRDGFVFDGWFKDEECTQAWNFETDVLNANTTLYAKWAEAMTVSFDSNGGSAVASVAVRKGSKVSAPADPTKTNVTFKGWFTSEDVAFDFENTEITSNITLYAKWVIAVVVDKDNGDPLTTIELPEAGGKIEAQATPAKADAEFDCWTFNGEVFDDFDTVITASGTLKAVYINLISTTQAFYDLAAGTTVVTDASKFKLTADLDFTGFEWAATTNSFKGTLDGNGKTIKNLTISTSGCAGIFSKADSGSTIKNLILDNISVTSTTERAGGLVGQVGQFNAAVVTFEDIVISNSAVVGNKQEGAGAILGSAKSSVKFKNITVLNCSITNNSGDVKDGGGGAIVGQLDQAANTATFEDIFVKASITSSTARVGGLIGEAKNSAVININRAVVIADLTAKDDIGGIIGRNNAAGAMTLNNVVAMVNITVTDASKKNVGTIAGRESTINLTNAYFINPSVKTSTGAVKTDGTGVNASGEALLSDLSGLTTEKLAGFASSELWTVEAGKLPLFGNVKTVTFVDGETVLGVQYVLAGQKAAQPTYSVAEKDFEGWYADAEFETEFDFNAAVSDSVTVYGKYVGQQYTVTLDYNYEGAPADETLKVDKGASAALPSPTREGYVFKGWNTAEDGNGSFFTNADPINANVTLYAIWVEELSVTLDFNYEGAPEDNIVKVEKGGVIEELPAPSRDGYTFKGWNTAEDGSGEFITETTPINESATLYAIWEEVTAEE